MGRKLELFDDFCQNTTFHGFIDLFVAKIFWKLIWAIIILLAGAAVVYEIRMVVMLYMSTPIITDFELQSPTTREIPSVEICLESAIDPRKVWQYKLPAGLVDNLMAWRSDETPRLVSDDVEIDFDGIQVFPRVIPEMIQMLSVPKTDAEARALQAEINKRPASDDPEVQALRHNVYMLAFEQLAAIHYMQPCCDYFTLNYMNLRAFMREKSSDGSYSNSTADQIDVRKLWRAVSYRQDEVITEMIFGGAVITDELPKRVSKVYDQTYGTCYMLDTTGLKQHDPSHGLTLMIHSHRETSWNSYPNSLDGIAVRIQPNGYNPTANRLFNVPSGDDLGLGRLATISLTADNYHMQVNEDQELCRDDMDHEITTFRYTGSACRTECLMRSSRDLCGCVIPLDPRFLTQPYEHEICIDRTCATDLSKMREMDEACMDACVPRCNYRDFKAVVTYLGYPSLHAMFKLIGLNLKMDATSAMKDENQTYQLFAMNQEIYIWSKEIIGLNIAFDQLEYFEVTQKAAMSMDAFVSSVGGQLGLFMGASIISIIQLLLYICRACGFKLEEDDEAERRDAIYDKEELYQTPDMPVQIPTDWK